MLNPNVIARSPQWTPAKDLPDFQSPAGTQAADQHGEHLAPSMFLISYDFMINSGENHDLMGK